MNRITFFLLLLVFPLTFVPQNEENRGYRVKVGDPVPPLTLQMINGEIWTNKDFIDKTVVYNLQVHGVVFVKKRCLNWNLEFGRIIKKKIFC